MYVDICNLFVSETLDFTRHCAFRLGQDYGYTAQVPQLIPLPQVVRLFVIEHITSCLVHISSHHRNVHYVHYVHICLQDYSNLINSISSFTCPRSIGEESKTPRYIFDARFHGYFTPFGGPLDTKCWYSN